jgi:hypothetical protein
MSDTVPNAFLLLLGQIGLFLVALVYGLPINWLSGRSELSAIGLETWSFYLMLLLSSSMMVANILIGWGAVRSAQNKFAEYSSKLFTVDLLIIFTFFGMNNIIIYSVGAGFAAFDPQKIVESISSGIAPTTKSATLGALILLSATYLALCKTWNKEFYRLAGTTGSDHYEKQLAHVIVIQLLISGVAFLTPGQPIGHFIILMIWIASWITVNFGWIKANFTDG